MDCQAAIEKFILAKVADGRAERTIADYRRVLGRYAEHMNGDPVATWTRDDARAYVAALRTDTGWSHNTVAIHVRNLRAFWKWLHVEGHIDENLADAIRMGPDFEENVKEVILMSGCIYGRAGRPDEPIPEWNVRADVESAKVVYGSKVKLTIVPLDSTTHVRLSDKERERVRKYRSPLTWSLECLLRLWTSGPNSRMTRSIPALTWSSTRTSQVMPSDLTPRAETSDTAFSRVRWSDIP